MIGLIDCDALARDGPFIPNLEIMKLYSYYKPQEMVKLLLDDSMLDACSIIYLRKDKKNSPIPHDWLKNRNVNWGGMAFTNNTYVPMAPEIEDVVPSYSVYNAYIKDVVQGNYMAKCNEIEFLDYSFLRLHNGRPISTKSIRYGMPLLIYDGYIMQEGYEEKLKTVAECEPSQVRYVFPVMIQNEEELEVFKECNLIYRISGHSIQNELVLNIDFQLVAFKSFLARHLDYFKSFAVSKIQFVIYPPDQQVPIESKTIHQFEKVANIIFYSMTQQLKPGVYPAWSPPGRIGDIVEYFTKYINTPVSWIKHWERTTWRGSRSKTTKLKKDILTQNPELRYLLGVRCAELYNGGIWYGKFRN